MLPETTESCDIPLAPSCGINILSAMGNRQSEIAPLLIPHGRHPHQDTERFSDLAVSKHTAWGMIPNARREYHEAFKSSISAIC